MRYAHVRFARVRFAPVRSAHVRFAPERFAPERSAPERSALLQSELAIDQAGHNPAVTAHPQNLRKNESSRTHLCVHRVGGAQIPSGYRAENSASAGLHAFTDSSISFVINILKPPTTYTIYYSLVFVIITRISYGNLFH